MVAWWCIVTGGLAAIAPPLKATPRLVRPISTVVTSSQPLRLPPTLADAAAAYQTLASEHYLPLAAVQMGAVRLTSDTLCQHMHGNGPLDMVHLAAMCFAGVTVSGVGGALWVSRPGLASARGIAR
jgi:hypothetical protein